MGGYSECVQKRYPESMPRDAALPPHNATGAMSSDSESSSGPLMTPSSSDGEGVAEPASAHLCAANLRKHAAEAAQAENGQMDTESCHTRLQDADQGTETGSCHTELTELTQLTEMPVCKRARTESRWCEKFVPLALGRKDLAHISINVIQKRMPCEGIETRCDAAERINRWLGVGACLPNWFPSWGLGSPFCIQ